jgi:pre-mRNA branch site protein p14
LPLKRRWLQTETEAPATTEGTYLLFLCYSLTLLHFTTMGDHLSRRSANVSCALCSRKEKVTNLPLQLVGIKSRVLLSLSLTTILFSFFSFQPQSRLPPEVNRILYVRNLPFTISAEELYAIFGKYGAVYQIRLGDRHKDTRGTAFVVYEDIYDAKAAVDHLSGFNVGGRYLVVLYYQPAKFQKRTEAEEKQKELELLRSKINAKKAQSKG